LRRGDEDVKISQASFYFMKIRNIRSKPGYFSGVKEGISEKQY
jgi:hypothetical protein